LQQEVGADDIAEVVSKVDRIPVARMLEGERAKLLRMEAELHRRVIGQDEAVEAVANAIRRGPRRAAGPAPADWQLTVPGSDRRRQTELARSLADFLFDDEQALVRLDMSEYMEKHAVSA